MRIAAFTRYGARAASTRQRFVQYFPALREAGIHVDHRPLFGDDYVTALVDGTAYPKSKVAAAYARRFEQLAASREADLYWVYVELLPYLPALVERLATAGKTLVYEFDDAFFHSYDQSGNPAVRAVLGGKHAALLKHAAACICGNAYLRDFAVQHCRNSIVIPSVVDAARYLPVPKRDTAQLTIGWIGSPSTWVGVRPILPVLERVVAEQRARFLVIGAGYAAEGDVFAGMELKDWNEATEIADVQAMDIGIMPLLDRPFERGKSGYKLIQYMACGLPVVASPIGVNSDIVSEGRNGFLAATNEEWHRTLSALIADADMRRRFGEAGRSLAVKSFSLASQKPRLIQLFRSLA
jgi:glycosyltransferase involved in cell wall biosynthesis